MSDWKLLEKIVSKLEEGVPDANAIQEALDDLNTVKMSTLTRELCKDKSDEGDQRISLFSRLFRMVKHALEIGMRHTAIGFLPRHCKKLAEEGVFVPDALAFLQEILNRYAGNKDESREAAEAFEGLLAGVNKKNIDLAKASMLILSALIPRLHEIERTSLLKKIDELPARFRKKTLIPTLKKYCEIIDRAEKSITSEKCNVKYPWEVLSVHSHKGGVGKTLISTALAVELASQGNNRVCLVDCDDEGPSLFNMLPFQDKNIKDVMFFVDWFCSPIRKFPLEKIPEISVNGNTIHCIPGSFLAIDITRLDERQRGRRPQGALYTYGQYRIAQLIKQLKDDLKFDCVVLDTGPGMAHLALDVLMATLSVGGSQIFVMRPRTVDIAQFCTEWDWLYSLKRKGKSSVVINFTDPDRKNSSLDLADGEELAKQINKSPQFRIFNNRLFGSSGIKDQLTDIIVDIWDKKTTVHKLPENIKLRHAEDISKYPQNETVKVICKDDAITKLTRDILKALTNQ